MRNSSGSPRTGDTPPGLAAKAAGVRTFLRYACKMATGTGKTTVMGMLREGPRPRGIREAKARAGRRAGKA